MKKIFITLTLFLAAPVFAAVELDTDRNGATDISRGGTNSTTISGAKANLGIPSTLSALTGDTTHRVVTDAQIGIWDSKQAALTAGTDYLTPNGSAAGLVNFPASLATDSEVSAAIAGYAIPAATTSALGGVKQGDRVTIAVDGTISADVQPGVAAYSELSGLPTLGTASALNVGTSASNVVQLDGSGQLPAVSGALLTNLPSTSLPSATEGQMLQANSSGVYVSASVINGLTVDVGDWASWTFNGTQIVNPLGTGDNQIWPASKNISALALKSDATHTHTGYEPADANIIKVAEIDTLAKFEALLGWSPGSGGSVAITEADTDPTFASMTTGNAIVSKASGDLFVKTATGGYKIIGDYTADPITYNLTITPASFTGADKFTYNSTDYTTEQVITGLSADTSFTVTPDTGRVITCAGTGLTDNTGGSYTANTDMDNVVATCTSAASLAIFASNTTAGATVQFGQETGREYVGQMITGAGTHVIKKVTFRAASINGDISGKTYACAIYSRSGSALDAALSVSTNNISGATISSGSVLEFTFTGQSTTTGNAVVIYETGAVDINNYLNLDYSATNTDATYSEYTRWGESKLATGGSTGDLWYALYE